MTASGFPTRGRALHRPGAVPCFALVGKKLSSGYRTAQKVRDRSWALRTRESRCVHLHLHGGGSVTLRGMKRLGFYSSFGILLASLASCGSSSTSPVVR